MSTVPPPAKSRPARTDSGWSMRVATVDGIPIRIHFTFFLFLAWVALVSKDYGAGYTVALVLGIFFCVVLHELGHALVAKHFGIQTRDITLYPMGGVAMLQGRFPKPKEEFWIALAGPFVNVVIAVVLGAALFIANGKLPPFFANLPETGLIPALYVANIILPIFNLIPAFPMDGGRVLRALLAMSMPEAQATRIAARIGQILAIFFALFGILSQNPILIIVAFFVFLGADQEAQATVGRSIVDGHRMAEAMMTNFATLASGETLGEASETLLAGSQHDFPVMVGEEVLGILTRDGLIRGLALEGPGAYIAGHMQRDFQKAAPEDPLSDALEAFSQGDNTPILIMQGDELLGMVTRDNFGEFLMLEQVRQLGLPRRV